jgi:hypothetical protein
MFDMGTYEAVRSSGNTVEEIYTMQGILADGTVLQDLPVYEVSGLVIGECHLPPVRIVVLPNLRRMVLGMQLFRHLRPFTVTADNPPRLQFTCPTKTR